MNMRAGEGWGGSFAARILVLGQCAMAFQGGPGGGWGIRRQAAASLMSTNHRASCRCSKSHAAVTLMSSEHRVRELCSSSASALQPPLRVDRAALLHAALRGCAAGGLLFARGRGAEASGVDEWFANEVVPDPLREANRAVRQDFEVKPRPVVSLSSWRLHLSQALPISALSCSCRLTSVDCNRNDSADTDRKVCMQRCLLRRPRPGGFPSTSCLVSSGQTSRPDRCGFLARERVFNSAGCVSPYESVLVWCHRSGMTVAGVFLTLLRSLSPRA